MATVCVGAGMAASVGAQKAAYEKEYDIKRERGPSLYDRWSETLKGHLLRLNVVEDAMTQQVQPWPELGTGISASYVRLLDNQMMDLVIYEIAPRGATAEHRHVYEEFLYVVAGSGYSDVRQGTKTQRVKLATGSLFAPPLNAPHRHVNDGDQPLKLISITSMPFMVNIGGTNEYLYRTDFDFKDRYDAEEDYFRRSTKLGHRQTETNLVPDIRTAATDVYEERGGTNMHWRMSNNTLLGAHISEFPVSTYKRGHRHRHEAIIYILSGTGYSLVWKERGDKPQKVDWKAGGLFLAPVFWYHQHFNTGDKPVRYLAITSGGALSQIGVDDREEESSEDEDVAIRELFESELQKARTGR